MHREQPEVIKRGKGGHRKEWGRSDLEERDVKLRESERVSSKLHKAVSIHHDEAIHQIRELRSRY